MDEQQQYHLLKLRIAHQKRLETLELQAAKFGLSIPPHILIEIEDIQGKIASIEAQLNISQSSLIPISHNQIVVLFLSANPSDLARLRLGQELRDIRENLRLAKQRNDFVLEFRDAVRPGDITQAIFDVNPQIIHFSGHGTNSGELCFENLVGTVQPVQPAALAALFELVADRVNCVILNACYSEIQAKAIAQYIPYVIGMDKAISDKAAIAFAVGFYKALGGNRTIEQAYKFGCVEIQLQAIPEHLTPVLIQKGQAQP
jgi:CHAT domain